MSSLRPKISWMTITPGCFCASEGAAYAARIGRPPAAGKVMSLVIIDWPHRVSRAFHFRLASFACAFAGAGLGAIFRSRPGTVVAEWIVTLPNRLPKARLLRARQEIEAFLRMPRDSIEQRADQPRTRQPHV